MPAEAIIQTHVDEALRQQAEAVFSAAGLTFDEVVHRLLLRTVEQQAVPMNLLQLNSETLEAIEAARRGEFEGQGSVDDLFAELDADD